MIKCLLNLKKNMAYVKTQLKINIFEFINYIFYITLLSIFNFLYYSKLNILFNIEMKNIKYL